MTQMIDSIQEPIARQVREAVRQHYAVAAESGSCCGDGGDCCGTSGAATIDVALDSLYGNLYTADTSWLPAEVTGLSLGLSLIHISEPTRPY